MVSLESRVERLEDNMEEIEGRIEELEEEIEEIKQLIKPTMKILFDSMLLSKICDVMVEKGLRLTKIGEYTADDGSKFNVVLKLEEADSDD